MAFQTPLAHFTPRRLASIFVVASLISLAACAPAPTTSPSAGASSSTTSAPASKTLTIGATLEPPTIDPTASPYVAAGMVELYNVYETLVKIDSDGNLQPLLAQRWDLSSDNKTYTFYLNPAAKFASGKQVTAEAVAKNIGRVKTGQVDGKPVIAADGTEVKVDGKYSSAMKVIADVKAVDAATLQVTLSRPSNAWIYSMGDTAGMIADPDGFAALGKASAGSGPYAFREWKKGDSIVLAKNATYWGNPPRFDTVTFKYIPDASAMNAAMLAGTLDIISNEQAPDSLAQFQADANRFVVLDGVTNGEVTMAVNNTSAELKDVRVRKAIALAIDKKKIMADVSAGHGVVLGTMGVPTDPYYQDLSGVNAYNPEQAKALLKEAGVTNLTLRLRPLGVPYASAAANDVAAMLKAVGITANVEVLPPQTWITSVFLGGDYDLSIVSHAEARDVAIFNSDVMPGYYWHYTSPAFNAAWLAADSAPKDQYPTLMKKATQQLADDAAAVWLYMLPNLIVTKANVTGVSKNQTSDSFDVTTIATR